MITIMIMMMVAMANMMMHDDGGGDAGGDGAANGGDDGEDDDDGDEDGDDDGGDSDNNVGDVAENVEPFPHHGKLKTKVKKRNYSTYSPALPLTKSQSCPGLPVIPGSLVAAVRAPAP